MSLPVDRPNANLLERCLLVPICSIFCIHSPIPHPKETNKSILLPSFLTHNQYLKSYCVSVRPSVTK